MIPKSKYQELLYKHCHMDADYVVDILEISSADLIHRFPDRFDDYIEKEFGDTWNDQDEEASYDGPDYEKE